MGKEFDRRGIQCDISGTGLVPARRFPVLGPAHREQVAALIHPWDWFPSPTEEAPFGCVPWLPFEHNHGRKPGSQIVSDRMMPAIRYPYTVSRAVDPPSHQ